MRGLDEEAEGTLKVAPSLILIILLVSESAFNNSGRRHTSSMNINSPQET